MRRRRHPAPADLRELCAAVRRTLDLALVASGDPVLQVVYVAQVVPDPDARRLKVEVCSGDPDIPWEIALEHLRGAGGWLRSEVAADLQRRRTPELRFAWAGPEAEEGLSPTPRG